MENSSAVTPLSQAEFNAMMESLARWPRRSVLGIALSGGADSTALCLLLRQWARPLDIQLHAFIVDHHMRHESQQEAQQVADWAKQQGLQPHILALLQPPTQRRMELARQQRYALITERASALGVIDVLLGHHLDDQLETLALAERHGSGMDGAAGMPRCRVDAGLRWWRPLLPIPKSRLLAYLHQQGQRWHEDPSNHNPAYARAALRLGGMANHHRIELEQGRTQRANSLAPLRDAARQCVNLRPSGDAWLNPAMMSSLPPAWQYRLLGDVIRMIGGRSYRPAQAELAALLDFLQQPAARQRTLGHCLFYPMANGNWHICREHRHLPAPVAMIADGIRWDRFYALPIGQPIGTLATAPRTIWRELLAENKNLKKLAWPARLYASLPLWQAPDGEWQLPQGLATGIGNAPVRLYFMPRHALNSLS